MGGTGMPKYVSIVHYGLEIALGLFLIALSLNLNIMTLVKTAVHRCITSSVSVRREKPTLLYVVVIILLLALFSLVLFYKVDIIPAPYHVDEAAVAYDAKSIVKYGVDRYLYHNPVYFINFQGGLNALYIYLAVISVKLFGYSVLSVRLPAILLACIAALCFSLMVQREYGSIASIISMGLFIVLPFSIMHSRWALESYIFFQMMIISCSGLFLSIKTGKNLFFFISGVLFGLTLYTYAISYIVIPLFLGLCFLALLYKKQINWRNIFAFCIPLFIFAFPLLLFMAVNNGLIDEIKTSFISIPKLPIYRGSEIGFRNIFNNLKLNKTNIFYKLFVFDGEILNVRIKFGTMYFFSIPLMLWGFFLSWKNAVRFFRENNCFLDLMMIFLFLSGFFTSLLLNKPNIVRANEVFIPFFYFLCIGILAIYQKKKAAAAITGIVFVFSFVLFYHDYLTEFPKEQEQPGAIVSINDLKDALNFASALDNDKIYISQQNYLWTILALDIDPYTFNEKKVANGVYVRSYERYHYVDHLSVDSISPDAVYISRDPREIYDILASYNFVSEKFNNISVLYQPK